MWLCRCPDRLNALSHTWHLYGLSPLWILLWQTRSCACANRLLQTLHLNGFSPEWLLLCTARSVLLRQHLPHSVHLYLLVWVILCWLRELCVKKSFPHWVHGYRLIIPLCFSLWSFKRPFRVNRLLHTVHTYGRGLSPRGGSVISVLSASVLASMEVSSV